MKKKFFQINIEKNGSIAGPEMESCLRQCTVCPDGMVTRSTCNDFIIVSCGLESDQYRIFCFFTVTFNSKCASLEKILFHIWNNETNKLFAEAPDSSCNDPVSIPV